MTREEFKNYSWGSGVLAEYNMNGLEYPVASVDFQEDLVGIQGVIENEPEEISWVRCENVTITGGIPSPV